MKISRLVLLGLFVSGSVLSAAAENGSTPAAVPAAYSSSSPAADAPPSPSAPLPQTKAVYTPPAPGEWTSTKPFSAVGVEVKVGIGGIGLDVATPLAKRFNLRAGASFFSYGLTSSDDGINYSGTLKLQSGDASIDFYPFHGTFRLSPGVTFSNHNHVNASAMVPGGQTFTLNGTEYTSSTTDPVSGTGYLELGEQVAPSFTLGWGNMIPRHGGHWSFPFEIGFKYIHKPTVNLALAGSACQDGICDNVATDPQIQANVQGEENTLNSDLSPLRFFPVVSIGVSYKFGH